MSIGNEINNALDQVTSAISQNPLTSTAIAGTAGIALGATTAGIIASKSKRSKKKSKKAKKRNSKTKRGRAKDRKYISRQKHEQRYLKSHPKRRKTGEYYRNKSNIRSSSKRGKVKYTKKGQPYIIQKDGKARFIKKK